MKKFEKLVDDIIQLVEDFTTQVLKLVFRLTPVLFILFVLIALAVKAFHVIVLGEQP